MADAGPSFVSRIFVGRLASRGERLLFTLNPPPEVVQGYADISTTFRAVSADFATRKYVATKRQQFSADLTTERSIGSNL